MKNLVKINFFFVMFVVLCLAGTTGCAKKVEKHVAVQVDVAPKQGPDYKTRKIAPDKHLPTEATNVKLLNNFWTYFELDVGGKTRKFLMHHSHPKDDWQGRESLVELRD